MVFTTIWKEWFTTAIQFQFKDTAGAEKDADGVWQFPLKYANEGSNVESLYYTITTDTNNIYEDNEFITAWANIDNRNVPYTLTLNLVDDSELYVGEYIGTLTFSVNIQ